MMTIMYFLLIVFIWRSARRAEPDNDRQESDVNSDATTHSEDGGKVTSSFLGKTLIIFEIINVFRTRYKFLDWIVDVVF